MSKNTRKSKCPEDESERWLASLSSLASLMAPLKSSPVKSENPADQAA